MNVLINNFESIKNDYLNGEILKVICKKYNITSTSLISILKKANIYNGQNHTSRALLAKSNIDIKPINIIQELLDIFQIKLLGDILLIGKWGLNNQHIISNKILYICIDNDTNEILKIGQTCNWRRRVVNYKYKDSSRGIIRLILFEVSSWEIQDKLEIEIRKHLINLGYKLPWDNTNGRLNK